MNDDSQTITADYYNNNDPIQQRTRIYHRRLLELTATSNTKVAWDCAQHVLDTIWHAQENTNDDSTPSSGSSYYYYACQSCGQVLHPGYKGTTLRVERSSSSGSRHRSNPSTIAHFKTLRRRRQRQRKKLALAKSKESNYVNRGLQVTPMATTTTTTTTKEEEEPRMILLKEDQNFLGLDRHHLAIRCGQCRCKVRLKGMKREKGTVQQGQQQPAETWRNQKLSKRQASSASNQQRGRDSGVAASVPADSDDFLQLPPAASAASTSSTKSPSLMAQGQTKKKKKKKKTETKGSKLMNFLNSLND